MLVVVLCKEALPPFQKEPPKVKECFLAVFGIFFLVLFIVFSMSQEKQPVESTYNMETPQL